MIAIFNIIIPIFMTLGIGYFALRQGIINAVQTRGMGIFVLNIALPALIFKAVATTPFQEILLLNYLVAYGIGSLLAFVFALGISLLYWQQNLCSAALNGMGLSFSNSGFIGYSVLTMVVGSSQAVNYLAMNILVENFIIIPLFLILADIGTQQSQSFINSLLSILKNLGKNPLVLSLSISIIFSIYNIDVPEVILKTSDMFANTAAPLALFVIGANLYTMRPGGNINIALFIGIGKLILHPALVLLIFLFLPATDIQTILAALLMASVPVGTMLAILGQRYGQLERSATIVMISTILSFVSMSIVLFLWQMILGDF